jgi:hypothetical protein
MCVAADATNTASNSVVGLAAILHRLDLPADMTDERNIDILQH